MKKCVINKDYFNKNNNSAFALMNNKDKVKLFEYLKDYEITYRDVLGLKENSTFGIEVEFVDEYNLDIDRNPLYYLSIYNVWFKKTFNTEGKVYNDYYLNNGWQLKSETGVSAEFSSPIFKDEKETYENIKKVYELLKEKEAWMNQFCGLHVNVGGNIFENNPHNLFQFLKLYGVFEEVILSFSRLTNEKLRTAVNFNAKSIDYFLLYEMLDSKLENKIITNYQDFICTCTYANNLFPNEIKDKSSSLSLAHLKLFSNEIEGNRIEFRAPNGTLDPILVQNTINTLVKLTEHHKEDPLANKYIDEYKSTIGLMPKITNRYSNIEFHRFYSDCPLDKALALCDIIFDNNLDKINFLKQIYTNQEEKQKQKIKTL